MIEKTMKALVVTENETIEIRELSTPVPQPGEVLVRLEACLICTWEQRIFKTGAGMQLPFVPGHEAAGVVAEVPEGTVCSFQVGDPVVVKTLDSCGHCEYCYQGLDNLCVGKAKKRFYDGIPGSGGMAQYISLPPQRLFPLPGFAGNFAAAAFAEPVACCLRSLDQAMVQMGDDVVVVGGGIMGQLHSVLAQKRGARVLMMEPDEGRRRLALQMGAKEAMDPLLGNPAETIRTLTGGRGASVVFITAPLVSLVPQYMEALGKTGRLVCYSSFHPDTEVPLSPNHIHYSEKILTGAYSPTSHGFYTASKLLGYALIEVEPFISQMYPMEEAETAFVRAGSAETMRVGIRLW